VGEASFIQVEIYTKADCHLCDVAKEVVERVQKRVPFALAVIDITSDPLLYEKYRYDIPVVRVNGKLAFRHRVEEHEFEERLRSA